MTKKKKQNNIISKQICGQQYDEIIIHEFIEKIDDENVKIQHKQNGTIMDTKTYIIRERYEKEREQLEQQINTLIKQINENCILRGDLERDIKQLRTEKIILENRIKELDDELHNTKQELQKIKDERMVTKLISAIQDVNGIHELERIIDPEYLQCLEDLRCARNIGTHYISWRRNPRNTKTYDDPEPVKNYKRKILIDKINDKNMCEYVKSIERNFGEGLIEEIKKTLMKFIDLNMPEPDEIVRKDVESYWK